VKRSCGCPVPVAISAVTAKQALAQIRLKHSFVRRTQIHQRQKASNRNFTDAYAPSAFTACVRFSTTRAEVVSHHTSTSCQDCHPQCDTMLENEVVHHHNADHSLGVLSRWHPARYILLKADHDPICHEPFPRFEAAEGVRVPLRSL